jgi:type IV secretion system protein VirB11
MAKDTDLLQKLLDQSVQKYLDIPEVENININKPCEVFVECSGKPKEHFNDPNLNMQALKFLSQTIATANNINYRPMEETLSAKLKDGTRVQVNQMPCVASGFTMSMRKRNKNKYSLESFGLAKKDVDFLVKAVEEHKTIIVSGGTSSGKTTFLELLCRHIPKNRRLVTIEDPQEITFEQIDVSPFAVTKVNNRERESELSYISADTLRKSPQSVIFGEIREGILATSFLNLVNTGHEGSMTTLHANSPSGAIDALINKIIRETDGKGEESIKRELHASIDIIIQLSKDDKGNRKAYFEKIEG